MSNKVYPFVRDITFIREIAPWVFPSPTRKKGMTKFLDALISGEGSGLNLCNDHTWLLPDKLP